jgi:hypothetical protein
MSHEPWFERICMAFWSCHDAHAAEHTFVQFYPTLKVVAKTFGTYNEALEQVTDVK